MVETEVETRLFMLMLTVMAVIGVINMMMSKGTVRQDGSVDGEDYENHTPDDGNRNNR